MVIGSVASVYVWFAHYCARLSEGKKEDEQKGDHVNSGLPP